MTGLDKRIRLAWSCVRSWIGTVVVILAIAVGSTVHANGSRSPQEHRWRTKVVGTTSIHFQGRTHDHSMAMEISRCYNGLVLEVATALNLSVPPSVEIRICPDHHTIDRYTLEDVPLWLTALAQPFKRRLFIRRDRIPANDKDTLHRILKHEAAHLVLGTLPRYVYERIPLWFHEGVAQKFAGRLFDFSWDELSMRVQIWESPALDHITKVFPKTEYEAETAYLYSEAIVGLMMRLWGSDVIGRVLLELHERRSFSSAMYAVTGRSVVWHEKRLHEEIASDRTVFVRLLYGLGGGICFLSMIPFLVVGFYRARRRRRAMHRAWEEEEHTQARDPDKEPSWGEPLP